MNSKERLEQYIKEDTIYHDYLNKHSSYVSEFDKFCIEHCQDIRKILEENERLKNGQKEFVNYLEDYLKLFDKKDIDEEGYYDCIEEILLKYEEIIGGENE